MEAPRDQQGWTAGEGDAGDQQIVDRERVPRHAGWLLPVRIDAGQSVLQVGAFDTAATRAVASHGANVVVLEADGDVAHSAGERSVHDGLVHVIRTSLAEWTADDASTPGAFDLVVFRHGSEREPPTADLAGVVAATAGLLRPHGALLLGVGSRWGLSRVLSGDAAEPADSPTSVSRQLAEEGFVAQRWLVAYPDLDQARAIVDLELLDDRDAQDIVISAVREPVAAEGPAGMAVESVAAFQDALRSGLAAAIGDAYLVLAARSAQDLADATREGQLWLAPPSGLAAEWQRPRELVDIGGRRLWRAIGSPEPQISGPLILLPSTFPAATGANGEDAIVAALTGDEGAKAGSTIVAAWWREAMAALETSDPERRPLDLRPRHFSVDADGTWHYQPPDLGLRFAAPPSALLFGAMARTLDEAVLARGWLAGIDPGSTVAMATRTILADAGCTRVAEDEYVWTEIAADVLARTREDVDLAQARRRVLERLSVRLEDHIDALPYQLLLAAGKRAPGLSAMLSRSEARRRPGGHDIVHTDSEDADSIAGSVGREPVARGVDAPGDPIPWFGSDDDYLGAVMRLEPWQAALDELLERERISPDGPIRVATRSTFATFLVPPNHYVRLYLKRFGGHDRHADEVRTLRMLERDPGLPVPRLLADGRLGDRGRYLVMSRIPGREVRDVRGSLSDAAMLEITAWTGAFLRRLRAIRLEPDERETAWQRLAALVAKLRRSAVDELRARSSMPAHLIDGVDAWLPSDDELLGTAMDMTLVHGGFRPRHAMVDVGDTGFIPTGIVGFGSSRIAHPMWDLAGAWADLRDEPDEVVSTFVREAGFAEAGMSTFARQALAWAILQRWHRGWQGPDLESVPDLDALAERVYGRAAAGSGSRISDSS